MAQLDSLPPDQRAALQLLLSQRQSYDQLAELLKIDGQSVRRRAHTALDALGPDTSLPEDERAQVADYLLGQQSDSEQEGTRLLLAASAPARDWARGVAGELGPLAGDAVPEIPAGPGGEPAREPEPAPAAPQRESPAAARERARPEPAQDEEPPPYERAATMSAARPSSRLGGALLLAGLGIVAAVVLIFVINGGDDDGGGGGERRPATTPRTQTGNQSRPVAQVNLFPPGGARGRTVGLAQIYQMANRRAIIVAGQGLRPGAYALWLYNSASDARLLGFVPERVGRNGRFATQGELPGQANRYQRLVVTREAVARNTRRPPSRPGPIVLQGDLNLR
jgi:hypothetical protein